MQHCANGATKLTKRFDADQLVECADVATQRVELDRELLGG